MSDLIQCPECGLRQTVRHAHCSRCGYAFTGSPDEYSASASQLPDKVKDHVKDESPTGEEPGADLKSSEPGARDFHVRGRPQAELYASEHSLPSRDPLLADLVAGRVKENPRYSDEFPLEADGADKIRSEPRPLANDGTDFAGEGSRNSVPSGDVARAPDPPQTRPGPMPAPLHTELRRPMNGRTVGGLIAVAMAAVSLVFVLVDGLAVNRSKTGMNRLIAGDDDDSAKSAEDPARASP